jgi:uncharacterized membrane protein
MKRLLKLIQMTFAGGVLFLVPLVMLALILGKAFGVAHKIVEPIAAKIPVQSVLGLSLQKVLAVIGLVLICLLAGCIARTLLAQKLVRAIETNILSNLPGYEFFKGVVGADAIGVDSGQNQDRVVLARFDDGWQLGFVLEQLQNGLVAVYIPGAPNPRSGSVYFLTSDRVQRAGVSPNAALKCLKRLGVGSNELLRNLSVGQTVAPEPEIQDQRSPK